MLIFMYKKFFLGKKFTEFYLEDSNQTFLAIREQSLDFYQISENQKGGKIDSIFSRKIEKIQAENSKTQFQVVSNQIYFIVAVSYIQSLSPNDSEVVQIVPIEYQIYVFRMDTINKVGIYL